MCAPPLSGVLQFLLLVFSITPYSSVPLNSTLPSSFLPSLLLPPLFLLSLLPLFLLLFLLLLLLLLILLLLLHLLLTKNIHCARGILPVLNGQLSCITSLCLFIVGSNVIVCELHTELDSFLLYTTS